VARLLASAGGWAFTIALALYAYYEDGVTGVALAVSVRTLPAAFAAPYVRDAVRRVPQRYAFALTAAVRGAVLVAVVMCVVHDFPFWVFLALVATYRIAGVAERPTRGVDEAGFLIGALAAGAGAALWTLDAVFVICAVALGLAAVAALVRPVDVEAVRASAGQRVAAARRLHVLHGGRVAARSAVELLVVIAAIDLLVMGIAGVGWLSAAWAVGLLAAVTLLDRPARAEPRRAIAASLALIGLPLVFVSMSPPEGVALVLLGLVGVGFGLALNVERGLGADARLEGEELVEAVARTAGATVAAVLVLAFGDAAALAVAGAVGGLLGLSLVGLGRSVDPAPAVQDPA